MNFFNNLTSETSKEDLLKKLKFKVIVHAAKSLGCNKIFFADDSTSLSICILTNVSLGRGAQLSLDVGFINNLYGDDLIIMRPLKDFTRDEVNYYLHMHNLKAINSKKLTTNTESFSSIRKLTEHFLTDLDSQFNGTMSTIFRVSEKVSAVAACSVDQNEHCILCDAPLDTSNLGDITSAIKATAFSKLMSSGQTKISGENGINNCSDNSSENLIEPSRSNTDNSCGNCAENGCINNKLNTLSSKDISLCLCYGCRLIFNDSRNHELLPKFLMNNAKEQLCLKSMRNEITNFLL